MNQVTSKQRPETKALTCRKCQDCCDDAAAEMAKAVKLTFDTVSSRILSILSSHGAQALVPGVSLLRPVTFFFTEIVGGSNVEIIRDPNWFDFREAMKGVASPEDLRYWTDTNLSVSRVDPSTLIQALFDGANNGLKKTQRRIRDRCKDCCLAKAMSQDNPQVEETGTIMRRV